MSLADRREAIGRFAYRLQTWPLRYGFALITLIAATLVQHGLGVAAGLSEPFILFYPAVLLVALLCGFGPALFATLVSMASADYLFLEPPYSFTISRPRDVVALVLFGVIGFAISGFGGLFRRHLRRLQEFEKAMEGLEEMITVVDRDYRYVIANRAVLNYRGMKRGDLLGRRVPEVVNPGVFETTIKEKLDECLQGKIVQYELRYKFAARGERDLFASHIPVEGAGGVDRIVSVFRDITDQKQAERALKLFRTLVDQSSDAVEVVDPETLRFLDVNEKACQDLGYSREELLTMTVFDIDPHIDESIRSMVVEKLHDSGFFVREGIHRRRDGSIFPVETSMKLVQLDRDYVVSVSRNISDRKQSEEALRDSEDRYRDLVEHSEDLVCTHDLEGNLLSVNPAPARLLGYEVAELLKIPMRELIVPEYRGLFDEYLAGIKVNGADKGSLCVKTRSGEQRVWEYNNTLRTEESASPIVRGMAHDVTERRAAEAALWTSEKRHRLLFEKNVAGVALSGFDGRLLDCNDAWARTLGYEGAHEVRGRQASEFYFAPSERGSVVDEIKTNGSFLGREVKLRKKDGTPVWVLVNAFLLSGDHAPLIQTTVIDITERRQAEQETRRNEERFRVALKDSPITVFNQDRDLRYTWIYNPQVHWQQQALGKTDDEILGPEKAARLDELKRQVLKTEKPLREEVMIPDGDRTCVFDLTIEPLFDADGNMIGITAAAMDIARLRELADGLQDARDKLLQEKSYLESEIQAELGFEEIIGQSPALREVLKKARVVAPTDSSVLLLGETGTGKELVARAVHELSSRHAKNFIKLNCAAVPSGLLESELFGHEKGAFTGAVSQKVGRIELADKGTLFLDEIGELPIELQPKLLRVLQDREFERLGGVHTLHVDVRIISATNCDLQQDIADKRFREDLFYRLNVFPIQLPALRERKSDIPILVNHFVRKHSARMGKHIESIPGETMEILQNWIWPGNIRELENMIERMVIMTKGGTLAAPPAELDVPQDLSEDNLTEMERDHIMRVLRETNGVLSGVDGAASRLGIKRTTLQSMLKRFGIEPRGYRRGTGTLSSE